jgi:hypothetical protein
VARIAPKLRLGAALAALGATSSIVWAMSGYAYPQDAAPAADLYARTAHQHACTS